LAIRVLLIDMPQMLRQIIRQTLAGDPRFELVGEYAEHVAIDVAVNRSRADYVVMDPNVFDSRAVRRRLLDEGPQVRVLTVSTHGGQTTLYELRAQEVALGELSPERLASVMTRMSSTRETGQS
jgi:DNA-binding NarL/FixJ family response regulator